ncbi:MAG: hypothetical protein R2745_25305 [Vicinamibacterales bacterium]
MPSPSRSAPSRQTDAGLALAVALVAALGCLAGASRINPQLVLTDDLWNVWFDADPSVYFVSMTNRVSAHWGANVHPMLAFFMYPPVFVLTRLFHFGKPDAAQIWMAVVAGLWAGSHVVLARVLGCRRVDAALMGLLAAVSSAAIFMTVVPEFHPFGGVTVTLALLGAALLRDQPAPVAWLAALNALAASATVTNWPLGALAAWQSAGWRRAAAAVAASAVLLLGLSFVQRLAFPSASWFLLRSEGYAAVSSRPPTPSRLADVAAGFLVHPVVMPAIGGLDPGPGRRVGSERWPYRAISVQHARLTPASPWGAVAFALWLAALAAGALAWYRRRRAWWVPPAALVCQAALYAIFGDETFLYGLNWLPLLLAVVAVGLAETRGPALRAAVALLVVLAAANNAGALATAADMLRHPDRYPVLALSQPPPTQGR